MPLKNVGLSLARMMLFAVILGSSQAGIADVVRPALVEISVDTRGTYTIELRASIEALLTGINARYKDTRQAPNAKAYDDLRVLEADELLARFRPFQDNLTEGIELYFDNQRAPLAVTRVEIPEPGYTKVPRMSLIVLEGRVDRSVSTLEWYYPERFGDNAVRVRQVDEANEKWHWSDWQWLRKDQRSDPFSLTEVFTSRPLHKVIQEYMVAGFLHILPLGLDHILFILGIFLLSTRWSPLLWQVTMFTVAHTITLGLTMADIINLPDRVVEPLIALSIAYIGVENIWHKQLYKGRLLLVFAFGLLHGMGFAGVLKEFGMPDEAFLTALISFNVGVELGQISILVMAFAMVGYWGKGRAWYRNAVVIPLSAMIAMTGLYWTYDRLVF